jgi:2-polyprenyl-3-methyl-5-hydroxy-6-metoxy-1,4-benzoquinol methylase
VNSLGVKITYNRALDFGCGVGRLSQALAKYFSTVDGVDISPSMIDLAKKYNRFENKVTYHLNNKNDLTLFNDNSFDLIYTTDVFQHMSPKYMEGYLCELLRILSHDGILIFQLPSEHVKLFNKITSIFGINRKIYSIYGKITHQPVMEYYLTPKETVEAYLLKHDAELIDAIRDSRKIVISYIYFVKKK